MPLVKVARRRSSAPYQVGPDVVDVQAAVRIEHAAAKLYRRQVAFPDRSQAHHETNRAGREAVLIRGRHDRRVEQRRRLDRILVREIRAYQQASRGGDSVTTVDVARNRLELPFQDLREISMAAVEALQDLRVQLRDSTFRNGQNSLHEQVGARLAGQQDLLARQEGLRQHASCIGQEAMPRARDRNGFHWTRAAASRTTSASISSPASSSIVSSDIKKQIVLSAPWFWLTCATPMPSRQPPVAKSYNGRPKRFAPRNQANASRERRR